ncbi:MAG TPA: glycosyltransferase family 87 protein [Acidimicrobiales bacterium]|nr:glycosyltransferase family 87 protein [Acidimicrobiales bacterium]
MPLSAPERPTDVSRAALAGFGAAVAAGTVLSVVFATSQPIRNARWALLVPLAPWAALWAVGVACALRLPRRIALPAVFAAAVVLRLGALAGPPVTSDDLFRYSWDARVQLSGTDPYRYTPSSAHLAHLRERWLWPDAQECARIQRPEGCSRINRVLVHTIYPPVAEAWFTVVYRMAGIGAHHKAWQVAGLLVDVGLVALLPQVLRAWGKDERWTALYALSPVAVIEVVNNGHVDGLAALAVVLALLATARRRPGWAGALLGVATLVKLYPALLGLALVVAAGRHAQARAWVARVVASAAAVVALAYLPHLAVVGPKVIGYLPGYLKEEHYDQGGRYLLAGLLHLPAGPTGVLAFAALAAAAAWVVVRRPPAPEAAALLMGALLLAVTPVQPWYAVTLLAVAAVAARPAWAAVAVAGYPYFFAVILDSPHAVAIGRLSYGLALLAVAVSLRRSPVPSG